MTASVHEPARHETPRLSAAALKNDERLTATAPAKDERPSKAWAVFVGMLLAFAGIKEVFRLMGESPVAAHVKGVSRREKGIGVAMLARMLQRIGEGVLGVR